MRNILRNDFFNRVELTGTVEQDPEFGILDYRRRYAVFTLVSSFSYYDEKGELQEQPLRKQVVFWQKPLVGLIEKRVFKGTSIFIRGCVAPPSFFDAVGTKHFGMQVIGKRLKFT